MVTQAGSGRAGLMPRLSGSMSALLLMGLRADTWPLCWALLAFVSLEWRNQVWLCWPEGLGLYMLAGGRPPGLAGLE